jgi:hypothetical protein
VQRRRGSGLGVPNDRNQARPDFGNNLGQSATDNREYAMRGIDRSNLIGKDETRQSLDAFQSHLERPRTRIPRDWTYK